MKAQSYMFPIYALLIQVGSKTIEAIPEIYQKPVALYMAEKEEEKLQ